MPDWCSITVSVSTHIIFRYHLPLNKFWWVHDTKSKFLHLFTDFRKAVDGQYGRNVHSHQYSSQLVIHMQFESSTCLKFPAVKCWINLNEVYFFSARWFWCACCFRTSSSASPSFWSSSWFWTSPWTREPRASFAAWNSWLWRHFREAKMHLAQKRWK